VYEQSQACSPPQYAKLSAAAGRAPAPVQLTFGGDEAPAEAWAERVGDAACQAAEAAFWRGVAGCAPLYGADSDVGSLFPATLEHWNLSALPRGPEDDLLQEAAVRMPGLNSPMVYLGAWRSFFALHTEDAELQGLSYLHSGAPKQWYIVPPAHAARVRRLAADVCASEAAECAHFLRHKQTLLAPSVYRASNVPLRRALQTEGTFVVVQAGAFHFGFNHGPNVAEAINFATAAAWLPIGRTAAPCSCRGQTPFVESSALFQRARAAWPERTAEWWCFVCACGESEGVTNFDAAKSHPTGEQFECVVCGLWGHVGCYDGYAERIAQSGADAELHCVACRDAWRGGDGRGEAWRFTCVCGKSEGASDATVAAGGAAPTGRMFECAGCGAWSHTECYDAYRGVDDEELPSRMQCWRCARRGAAHGKAKGATRGATPGRPQGSANGRPKSAAPARPKATPRSVDVGEGGGALLSHGAAHFPRSLPLPRWRASRRGRPLPRALLQSAGAHAAVSRRSDGRRDVRSCLRPFKEAEDDDEVALTA